MFGEGRLKFYLGFSGKLKTEALRQHTEQKRTPQNRFLSVRF